MNSLPISENQTIKNGFFVLLNSEHQHHEILRTQTLRGPNYWSIRRDKLIVMRLDLEDLAEKPSMKSRAFTRD